MPRRYSTSRRSRRPKKDYSWSHIVTDPANVTAGGQASVDLLQNFDVSQTRRGSLVERIVGKLYVWPGDASNITEATVGLAMIEADAEAASAIPDPLTDTSFPWMHWERFLLGTQATGELSTGEPEIIDMDMKPKRVIRDPQMSLDLIIENDDGTHTFLFALGLRILISRR